MVIGSWNHFSLNPNPWSLTRIPSHVSRTLQVAQEAVEGFLVLVVIFPGAEVADHLAHHIVLAGVTLPKSVDHSHMLLYKGAREAGECLRRRGEWGA